MMITEVHRSNHSPATDYDNLSGQLLDDIVAKVDDDA